MAVLKEGSKIKDKEIATKEDIEKLTNINHVTYLELKELINKKQLKTGGKYLLTDYATKYQQPTSKIIKTAEGEQLLLTASGNDTLETVAYSQKYPQDIIHYDFNNNTCEDDVKTPRNGFIINRIDTENKNQAPADFRGILWVRYTPDENQYYLKGDGEKEFKLVNYEIWTSGEAKTDVLYKSGNKILKAKNTNVPKNAEDTEIFEVVFNDITSESCALFINDKKEIYKDIKIKISKQWERKTFGKDCYNNNILGERTRMFNNTFGNGCVNNSFGNGCYNNSFGNSCYNNSFGNDCYYNIFVNDCDNNSFDNNCDNNIFVNNCNNNSFGNDCDNNSFGNGCYNNSFGNSCYNNSFGNECDNNIFVNECDNNSFGNDCDSNSFSYNCNNNTFGNNCNNNSLGNNCDSNSFGNNCDYNTFDVGCLSNSFGNNCDKNSFGNTCSFNSFGNSCSSNTFGKYCINNTFLNECINNKINLKFQYAFVKTLKNKDITNLNDVYNKNAVLTFSRDATSTYYYCCKQGNSNNIAYRMIP